MDLVKLIKKVSDFFIKIVIIFASILSLLNTIALNSIQAFALSTVTLLFILAIVVKGIAMLVGEEEPEYENLDRPKRK